MMTDGERRRLSFEALVLHGIWILISLAWGRKPHEGTAQWRGYPIDYFDANGLEGEKPKAYRRETVFPEIYTWKIPPHNG